VASLEASGRVSAPEAGYCFNTVNEYFNENIAVTIMSYSHTGKF